MITSADLRPAARAFQRLPWKVQMFVVFYLRANRYACTEEERDLAAELVEERIAEHPVEHRDLTAILDRRFPRERL
ncbi:hypothetical protein [Luteibacter sp. UNCMF366Tsu5.1]|uniref:hypothetical protein n=1 Tax=Luteibacter sp. UNCMF366Tsu5.1 TaxID=1502758 RepID=UPI001160AB05|nr:hypothetical protein [Luteibacter sp. UNCMF366Tsu5.1]